MFYGPLDIGLGQNQVVGARHPLLSLEHWMSVNGKCYLMCLTRLVHEFLFGYNRVVLKF
jgi:hypothetical protein